MKYKNKNKGFSLVELIVVIAIMAVMVAVLAPALLSYVERSRAQKDDSAMGEVTNAIKLAMAEQDVFDEVLYYSCYGNVSCYVHSDNEADADVKAAYIKTKDAAGDWKEQYTFGDNARLKDETVYAFAGNMRGMTITFQPQRSSNKATFVLGHAIINKCTVEVLTKGITPAGETEAALDSLFYADTAIGAMYLKPKDNITYVNGTPDYENHGNLSTMTTGVKTGCLYNKVRSAIGDEVQISSQTYRNSEYTVFIRMGSTGGNQASAQDAIQVYGQWNGTNLPNRTAVPLG